MYMYQLKSENGLRNRRTWGDTLIFVAWVMGVREKLIWSYDYLLPHPRDSDGRPLSWNHVIEFSGNQDHGNWFSKFFLRVVINCANLYLARGCFLGLNSSLSPSETFRWHISFLSSQILDETVILSQKHPVVYLTRLSLSQFFVQFKSLCNKLN